MKVNEYLVKRILELETEKVNVQMLREDIKDLNEMLDRYEMEKEHIKALITCNIAIKPYATIIDLNSKDDDFKTLLAILDIKPEDYEAKTMKEGD